jgi:hypothetical protein
MKQRTFYTIIFSFLFFSALAQGPQNVIKLNIFSPVVSTLSLSYERALSTQNSFQFNFFYTGASIGDTKFRGIGLTPEYRFYLSENKDAPAGFYVGPFLRYQNFNLSIDETNDEATLSTFGGGLLIGGHWIFKEKFSLDTFIGPAYSAGDIKLEDGSEDLFDTGIFSGFGVRFGVTVGYAF